MFTFKDYARYYDLLYRDKDYRGEVDFVNSLIKKYTPGAKSILELGCGTGGHAEHLVKRGFAVHGIDISDDMLRMAERRYKGFPPELKAKTNFEKRDVRTARLGRKFDIVLSLFDVMSYQLSNNDLISAFLTAKEHLNDGGVFIFDCWYGPGVLTDPPTTRFKEIEGEDIVVTRIAEPTIHIHDNIVDVNYNIFIRNKSTQLVEEIREKHCMRYLFYPEVEMILSTVGFEVISFLEFMKNEKPGEGAWNACFVCKVCESG
ncbi:class I SAM-dependent DNA methyltransferase [Thermodesulfobacteriota bacterium]